ncbi:MAG: hypothetical protein J0M04_05835 [Verrucomicrobia bacterium]|nr:hypothetical protein [Verrucomicrobiota bacterium]
MKMKIAQTTATILAAIALASIAFAAPDYGPKPSRKSRSQPTQGCCVSAPCKGVDCCTTKSVMTGYMGNHSQIPVYKRVIDCKGNCPVTVNNQRSICRKGSRA